MDGVLDLTSPDAVTDAVTDLPFDRRQDQLIELMAAVVRRLDSVEAEVRALHAELGGPAVGARLEHMERRLDEVLAGLGDVVEWAVHGPSRVP
jgi:hypothetical protein